MTTQSSVSRALKKINAVKGQDDKGNTVWSLPRPDIKEAGFFESLVTTVSHNSQLIVIRTRPGTANTVAKFLDDHDFDSILGSVAGDDTIIVVPTHVDKIQDTLAEVKGYMTQIGIIGM